jgi:hypothetical protein
VATHIKIWISTKFAELFHFGSDYTINRAKKKQRESYTIAQERAIQAIFSFLIVSAAGTGMLRFSNV